MKLSFSKKRNQAFTLPELMVVIGVVALMALLIDSGTASSAAKRRAQRLNCVSNLKQVNVAIRIWSDAHGRDGEYPMSASVTNGGEMELVATGNVAACFQVISNELGTPKILICPADTERFPATNFQNDFNNSHISYFVDPDASESYPQEIMSGDDNLAINGVPVKSGSLEIPSDARISFTAARHRFVGNIGYADGSVAEVSNEGLQSSLALATNGTPIMISRLAIP